jgi:A/G-specific adenine glycosylase
LMSIAFGRRYPAIDGNARRVLTRLFAVSKEKEIRAVANALVPASRPGYFNQSLMELGARICIAKAPRCYQCPLASHCKAHATNQQSWTISAKKKRTLKEVIWPLAIVRCNGKVLLRRRPMDGLLAGLWELPGGEQKQRGRIETTVQHDLEQFLGTVKFAGRIGEIRHSITNQRIRSPVLLFDVPSGASIRRTNSNSRWVGVSLLQRYPLSSMVHKAIKVLARHETHSL